MSLHPFYRSVVAMFCGPHDEGEGAPTRRIDRAIELSVELCSPLLIAGDGNHGEDVRRFARHAEQNGVAYIRALFDARRCTPSDAESIVHELVNNPPFMSVRHVYLVTDDWHMARASGILEGQLQRLLSRPTLEVIRCPVTTGPRPPDPVLQGERQGLLDYLAGRYGERKAHAPYGKPAEEQMVAE